MRTEPKYYIGLIIISILLIFTSIGFGQAKSKKKKSTDPNSVSVAYGKRIDSFAMDGYLFSLEMGFIKKRTFPFYIELSYFQRGYSIREYIADPNGHPIIVAGFDEETSAIEGKFKLNKYLAKNSQFDLGVKPFASIIYQTYRYEPAIQSQHIVEDYDIHLGLGIEVNFGLKIVNKLYFITALDYIVLRGGYTNHYVDNPLLPETHKTTNFILLNLLDPYFNARFGLRFLI